MTDRQSLAVPLTDIDNATNVSAQTNNKSGFSSQLSPKNQMDYQLLVEHTIDYEYKSRKKRNRRMIALFLVLLCIVILGGGGVFIYYQFYANNNNNNGDKKCMINPQFPMKGGGGCADECDPDTYSASLNFEDAWPGHFLLQMEFATNFTYHYINKVLNLSNDSIIQMDYTQSTIHMTMDYFCCLSQDDLQIANDIAQNFSWPEMHVQFDRVICTRNGRNFNDKELSEQSIIEVVVYATNTSQDILLGEVTELEQNIKDGGVHISVPRSANIGFHVTLGFFNGDNFDVTKLVQQLNEAVTWNLTDFYTENDTICSQNRPPIPNNYSAKYDISPRNYSCIGRT